MGNNTRRSATDATSPGVTAGVSDKDGLHEVKLTPGWLARDIAIASARLQPQVSVGEGEGAELCKRLEAYVAGVPAHRGLRTALDQTLCDALCRIRALENLAYSRDPFDPTKYGPPYKDCEQAALDQAREDALASNERERALSAQLAEARRERDEAQTILAASDRGSPIYKAVERVLDEHSARISMPNRKVAEAIALASGIAWHHTGDDDA